MRLLLLHEPDTVEAERLMKALKRAVAYRQPVAGLIHHSDRGRQYASNDYRDLLETRLFVRSMSRTGDCWDNAPVESFFGKLKTEWIGKTCYESQAKALTEIFKYIGLFFTIASVVMRR